MRAMTWFDHETESIWSQPWGMALAGPLEGFRLEQIPANILPWAAWLADHRDTMVLATERRSFGPLMQRFASDFVIRVAPGEVARAYGTWDEERVVAKRLTVVIDGEGRVVYTTQSDSLPEIRDHSDVLASIA